MARIVGVEIPNEKRIEIALTYIYGIGLTTSRKILQATNVNPDTRAKDLKDTENLSSLVNSKLSATENLEKNIKNLSEELNQFKNKISNK